LKDDDDDVDEKEEGEERRPEEDEGGKEEGDGVADLFTKALPLEALRRLRCWNDACSGSSPLPGLDSGPRLPPPGTAEKNEIDEASRRGGLSPPRRAADDDDDDVEDDEEEEAGGPKMDPTLAADDSPDDEEVGCCGPKSEPGSNDTDGPEDEDDEGKNESDDAPGSVPWLVERRLEGDDPGPCAVVEEEGGGPNKDEMASEGFLSLPLSLPLALLVAVGEKNGSEAEDAEEDAAEEAERKESKGDTASELKREVMEEEEEDEEEEDEEEEGEEKRMGSDMSEARSADETNVEPVVDESSVLPDLPLRFVFDFFSFLSTPANSDDDPDDAE
jgi:hypothetical protein